MSAAEGIFRGEGEGGIVGEHGYEGLPDAAALFRQRSFELHLIEEPALEGAVEVLLEVGGGNHNALQRLHFLQDDVLNGVLHLVD